MKALLATAALISSLLCSTNGFTQDSADATWIDVRTAEEFAEGHLEGATLIPYDDITAGVAALGLAKDAPLYLYCRSGRRSGIAKEALESKGYQQVINVGGLEQARAAAGAGLPR